MDKRQVNIIYEVSQKVHEKMEYSGTKMFGIHA